MHQQTSTIAPSGTSVADMKTAAKRKWGLIPDNHGHTCYKCPETALWALGWDRPKIYICKYHYEEYLYDYLRRNSGSELD